MSNFYGGRRRKTSVTVLAPYLLMFLIGLSMGYAIWGHSAKSEAPPVKTVSTTEEAAPAAAPPAVTPAAIPATGQESAAPVAAKAPEGEKPADTQVVTAPAAQEPEISPGRHLFIAVKGETLDDDTKALLKEVQPGGVVLLGQNVKNRAQVIKLVADIKDAAGLGNGIADLPLIAVDQEGGKVNRLRLENAPSAAELGAKDDAAARKVGREYAAACVARGIGVLLAPVMDIYEEGVSPATFENRAFGAKGDVVTTHALAFATGVAEGGVIAVAKHFPGHGASPQDTHEALAVLDRSGYELAKVMFPFAEASRVGIPGMLVGHIAVPVLENGVQRPASLSPVLIKSVLRKRLEFKGVVIADDLDMGAIKAVTPAENAAVESLAAGCDAVMYLDPSPERIRAACKAIKDAVASGKLAKGELADSARRLDAWQDWLRKPAQSPGIEPAPVIAKEAEPAVPAPPATPATSPATSEPKPQSETKPEPVVPATPPAEDTTPAEPTVPAPKVDTPTGNADAPKIAEGEVFVDVTKDRVYFVNGERVEVDKLAEVLKALPEETKKKALVVRPDSSLGKQASKIVLDAALAAGFLQRGVTSLPPSRIEELATATKASAPDVGPTTPPTPPTPPTLPLAWPFAPPAQPSAATEAPAPAAAKTPEAAPDVYEVQKGDSLTKIAARFGLKVGDVRAWNKLESDTVQAGQKLKVKKPESAPATPETMASDAVAEKKAKDKEKDKEAQAQAKDGKGKEKKESDTDVAQPPNTKKVMHEIQPGEMLSKIAAKYGVKQKDIIAWNKLEDDDIKYGRRLVIFVPSDAPEPKEAAPKESAPSPAESTPALAPAAPATSETPSAPATPPVPATSETPSAPATPPAPAAAETKVDQQQPDAKAPAPSASTEGSATATDDVKWIHTVAKGQKLADIAELYGVSLDALKQWNGLSDDGVRKGQKLNVFLNSATVPTNANVKRAERAEETAPKTEPYIVQPGDNLDKIAEKFSITRQELLDMNHMNNASQLRPGQRIKVPK